MKTNKYKYFKVIQQNYGQGWEDVSEYETDSQGNGIEIHDNKDSVLTHDLREYRLTGYSTRVVRRKELNA